LLLEIGRISGEVVAVVGASDPLTQKIYDRYMSFRTQRIDWGEIADQGYYNARSLPFQYG
jgi:TRAP-type mannitol/chloroaromatic compound transport system substrate-binding protein